MAIQAVVRRGRRSREGKGFSRSELKQAGLSFRQALKLEIPADVRRSSEHEENVTALKTYLGGELKRESPPQDAAETTNLREERMREREAVVDITEVKGIGPKLSEKLAEAGIKNANELASSSPKEIAEAIGSSEERASNLIEEARSLLKEKR
jgi:predicted flap endonuclease-1-like 5' DNA nuclease